MKKKVFSTCPHFSSVIHNMVRYIKKNKFGFFFSKARFVHIQGVLSFIWIKFGN